MRTFEVFDNVTLKQNSTFYGSVLRTHSDSFDPLDDELIIAHTEVPPDVLDEFVVSGIPPIGYVFVQFADETSGSSLVSEEDLVLLSRSFQIGDNVKRDGSPMIGAVINVSESYILEPISIRPNVAQYLSQHMPALLTCTSQCPPSLPDHFTHPNPHLLLYNVPSREVKRAQDVMKDDYIISGIWAGLVDEVEYDVVIALENKSVVVVTGTNGLHIPVPDHGKPLIALPEFDGFKRPDVFGATQGWARTIPVQQPLTGYFVIIERSRLRNGRWIIGSYDNKCPSQGIVIDVRAREASVDWVSSNLAPNEPPESETLPKYDIPIYENIRTFRDPASLRLNKDVLVYDSGRMPVKNPRLADSSTETQSGQGSYPDSDVSHNIYPGQDMSVGFQVKFRDPTAAAIKYHGSQGSSHGKFIRLPSEAFGGWDLNEFKIVHIQQEATVLWQDGTVTTTDSVFLQGFTLFEAELAPTDLVLKREGMRQRPVYQRKAGSNIVKDFDEMTFFERPHDLLPQNVGVVQTVDPTERIARVRWYKEPKIELRASGQILAPDSRFGPIGDLIEDVSLYEIMSFPSLMRRLRDMCVVGALEGTLKHTDTRQTPTTASSPRPTDPISLRGSGFGASITHRLGLARGSRTISDNPPVENDGSNKKIDWIGEIVAMGLDGSISVRLGGSQPCRDILVDADSILAIIDDREYVETVHDNDGMMDVGSPWVDTSSEWSDGDSAPPISESVEYEGGERLDNDSGDENWVSYEDDEFEDAEEELDVDGDVSMADANEQENTMMPSKPPRSLVTLRTMLGSEPPPHFLVLDREPPTDQYGLHSPSMPESFLKRISQEHRILATSLPKGQIYVRTYESRLDLLRCLIVGPKDTPYENAPFLIDLHLPTSFPNEPPAAHFHSWTSGLGRINPNLYEEGKICLSLLGTWSGKHESEKWSDKATILQLLVSLQGLVFVRRPFYNEAGFEGYEHDKAYTREAEQYSEKAFVMARGFVKYALQRPPGGVKDILAWLYLPRDTTDAKNSLLGTIIQRSRLLIQKSEVARLDQDDSLMDAEGESKRDTRVFLKPLSRGASVMLSRLTDELQSQLDQLSSQTGADIGSTT